MNLIRLIAIPMQMSPSNLYPTWQSQMYDPMVLEQMEWAWLQS